MNSPLVSIIILNWNQPDATIECLNSVKAISYPNYEIIVVDNGSQDDSIPCIKRSHPDVRIIALPQNTGYARGNNEGMKASHGDLFLILNNDVVVSPDFLEPLVDQSESWPRVGALSPKILSAKDPKHAEYSGFKSINPFTGRGFMRKGNVESYGEIEETGIMHGAAFLVKRKVAQETGLLYEDYFLYYEEVDWSYRIRNKGYKIVYVGVSVVYHYGSKSHAENSTQKTRWLNRNRIIFARRRLSLPMMLVFSAYLFLFSMPFNILKFMVTLKIDHLEAYLKGVYCGLTEKDVYKLNRVSL